MPHNGFIYEARMDMMENSGHWYNRALRQVQLRLLRARGRHHDDRGRDGHLPHRQDGGQVLRTVDTGNCASM